mmetsp:Transcript_33510/g.88231  ORF Transcript_33510/g.88231 Transcript_33510/m.88231 type:complete len:440 (-) Transcript_33510:342-1661(-)
MRHLLGDLLRRLREILGRAAANEPAHHDDQRADYRTHRHVLSTVARPEVQEALVPIGAEAREESAHRGPDGGADQLVAAAVQCTDLRADGLNVAAQVDRRAGQHVEDGRLRQPAQLLVRRVELLQQRLQQRHHRSACAHHLLLQAHQRHRTRRRRSRCRRRRHRRHLCPRRRAQRRRHQLHVRARRRPRRHHCLRRLAHTAHERRSVHIQPSSDRRPVQNLYDEVDRDGQARAGARHRCALQLAHQHAQRRERAERLVDHRQEPLCRRERGLDGVGTICGDGEGGVRHRELLHGTADADGGERVDDRGLVGVDQLHEEVHLFRVQDRVDPAACGVRREEAAEQRSTEEQHEQRQDEVDERTQREEVARAAGEPVALVGDDVSCARPGNRRRWRLVRGSDLLTRLAFAARGCVLGPAGVLATAAACAQLAVLRAVARHAA